MNIIMRGLRRYNLWLTRRIVHRAVQRAHERGDVWSAGDEPGVQSALNYLAYRAGQGPALAGAPTCAMCGGEWPCQAEHTQAQADAVNAQWADVIRYMAKEAA